MSDAKVKKIRLEYEDGSVREAKGEDADKIWKHIQGTEDFWFIHGFVYDGPCMKEIKKAKKPKSEPEKMIKKAPIGKIQFLNEKGEVIGEAGN